MSDKDNSGVTPELAKAIAATGIADPNESADKSKDEEAPEEKEETKLSSEEEDEEEESDESDDESDEGEKDGGSKPSKPSAEKRDPLKAAFSQINELRKSLDERDEKFGSALTELTSAIKDLKSASTPSEKKEAKEDTVASIEELVRQAEEAGSDPAFIRSLVKAIQAETKGAFEKELAPLKEALAKTKDTTEKLSAKEQEEERVRMENRAFTEEWSKFTDDLKKAYPNATEELLADARSEMRKLATSKEYGGESLDGKENKGKQPMPLDYILFKEKAKFDTILNVKKGKSGASKSADLGDEDTGDADEIDLDPENMTPAKLKEYERRKYKRSSGDKLPLEILDLRQS